MKLKFFITGGTICKRYNEISGALEFRDSFIPNMLERGRCKLDYSTEQLMLKDSPEMMSARVAVRAFFSGLIFDVVLVFRSGQSH